MTWVVLWLAALPALRVEASGELPCELAGRLDSALKEQQLTQEVAAEHRLLVEARGEQLTVTLVDRSAKVLGERVLTPKPRDCPVLPRTIVLLARSWLTTRFPAWRVSGAGQTEIHPAQATPDGGGHSPVGPSVSVGTVEEPKESLRPSDGARPGSTAPPTPRNPPVSLAERSRSSDAGEPVRVAEVPVRLADAGDPARVSEAPLRAPDAGEPARVAMERPGTDRRAPGPSGGLTGSRPDPSDVKPPVVGVTSDPGAPLETRTGQQPIVDAGALLAEAADRQPPRLAATRAQPAVASPGQSGAGTADRAPGVDAGSAEAANVRVELESGPDAGPAVVTAPVSNAQSSEPAVGLGALGGVALDLARPAGHFTLFADWTFLPRTGVAVDLCADTVREVSGGGGTISAQQYGIGLSLRRQLVSGLHAVLGGRLLLVPASTSGFSTLGSRVIPAGALFLSLDWRQALVGPVFAIFRLGAQARIRAEIIVVPGSDATLVLPVWAFFGQLGVGLKL